MDNQGAPQIQETDLYKYIWALSIVILIAAAIVCVLLWQNGWWSALQGGEKQGWTAAQKREALEKLNNDMKLKGVSGFTPEEKEAILNHAP
jgi:hypothetical protein